MNGCDVCSDADGGPSPVVVWGFRWLVFRLMLGAGLIKIRGTMHKKTWVQGCMYNANACTHTSMHIHARAYTYTRAHARSHAGDQCWRDLTCMDYHYETQVRFFGGRKCEYTGLQRVGGHGLMRGAADLNDWGIRGIARTHATHPH